ncbi:MAG TPA: oxalurate catabolism protein HpxZ [Sphingomonadaceae bacterium]|nr:oxalurate catabolism protein HpxZ [Sphingomonadaceae bacterium]
MIIDDPATKAELEALSARYEAALMANDLAELDGMFWQSPKVVRLGVGENLYGIEEIAAFRAARRGGSPAREVIRTTITTFGTDLGVINVEFQRVGSETIGRQSQTWVRLPEGWRIVSAHVSLMSGGH